MARDNSLPLLPKSLRNTPPPITCSTCPAAKQTPHPHRPKINTYPVGYYISSDTCGPLKPPSRHGNQHFVTYLDCSSRFLIVFFLPDRSSVKHTTPLAIAFIRAQHGKPPLIYRSDNAREFQSHDMNHLYNLHGITYRSNTPHQPQENSLAERINRSIVTATRAALHHSQLPDSFWEDAMRDVIFKYNILTHDSTGLSPYQLWYLNTPDIPRLFAFGQIGTIPNYRDQKSKLEPRADPARFMHNTSPSHIVALNLRTNQYKHLRSLDFKPYYHHLDPLYHHPQSFAAHTSTPPIPSRITELTPPPSSTNHARQYPDAALWASVHNNELDTIEQTNTIKWVPNSSLPPSADIIPLKMTYRYKRSDDGNILRYKARCTVRGDRMRPHTHFDPDKVTTCTAERPTIRTIMCLAAALNLNLDHFDISSAFLHEKYEHVNPVYVQQPPRFDGSYKHPCRAGILVGNLYGTPPASHIYFDALSKFLTASDYHQADSDNCLFYQFTQTGLIFISITIDDFFVAASSGDLITALYNTLKTRYKIRRLGSTTLFLNWRIARFSDGSIHISQPHTIRSILEQHQLSDSNPKPTPYPCNKPKNPSKPSPRLNNLKTFTFRHTIAELHYVADSTRPDIAHIVSRLAAVMHTPTELHWGQLRYLLKYLKGTLTHGSLYKVLPFDTLTSYADAGFANSDDRKSYAGIVHIGITSPIMWQSKKQKTVSLSTCEAEYLSASTAAQQSLWLRRLLADLDRAPSAATPLFMDNNAAIQVRKNTSPTKHRKYIDLRHHFLNNLIFTSRISLEHVPSLSMLADILTKALKPQRFQQLRAALNIIPPPPDCHQRAGDCQTAHSRR